MNEMNQAQKPMAKGGKRFRGGDASNFAQSVYGDMKSQHPVSNSNNVIQMKHVSNMQGGRKRRRTKKRRSMRRKSRSSRSYR